MKPNCHSMFSVRCLLATHRSWMLDVVLTLLLLALPAAVQAEDYTYTINAGTITITGYTGPGGAVTIPDMINGLPVTSIGGSAFAMRTSLMSVVIVNSVTNIGGSAFESCTSLTNVVIGSSVTSIGDRAFSSCTNLTSIMIPNSVTCFGEAAFSSCDNLTSVTIPNSVTSIGRWAFASCDSLTSVTIPSSVTSIGGEAFAFCTSLSVITVDTNNPAYSSLNGVLFNNGQTTLIQYPAGKAGSDYTIPSSVTNIGSSAFADCTSLTSVSIPHSVADIGQFAFGGCAALSSATIPSSVSSIGSFAFVGCTSLTGVFFQGNAPSLPGPFIVFDRTSEAVVYYLPGTMGWEPTFDVLPTALWLLPNPLILNNSPSFGVQTNAFGFVISWATNVSVVVEDCTNLANPIWSPVATNMLTGGSSYFSDPEWTNYPARFYRLRSP